GVFPGGASSDHHRNRHGSDYGLYIVDRRCGCQLFHFGSDFTDAGRTDLRNDEEADKSGNQRTLYADVRIYPAASDRDQSERASGGKRERKEFKPMKKMFKSKTVSRLVCL